MSSTSTQQLRGIGEAMGLAASELMNFVRVKTRRESKTVIVRTRRERKTGEGERKGGS